MRSLLLLLLLVLARPGVQAWDYDNHRLVTDLALQALPTNFPAFVLTPEARERIRFLSGEADRWRNTPELSLKHVNHPDHYFDMEFISDLGMMWDTIPSVRYEFTWLLKKELERNPDSPLRQIGSEAELTRGLIGFLPWTIAEYFAKLKSSFSYLKTYEQHGTAAEIANAQQNILYTMGVMAHFPGDGAQPLHTTKHFNGWAGPNPNAYTTNRTFHAYIDGGYLARAKLDPAELARTLRVSRPLRSSMEQPIFELIVAFLNEQFVRVEPLYKLEKRGLLKTGAEPEARQFMAEQLRRGAQFLSDLWVTAWHEAAPDTHLQSQLAIRKLEQAQPK
ncbi:MAG: hypothetical protein SFY81_06940 [Verrucomicrobiota bacterium]|nr:hypothetical protein [Verrucomicrobiota bacterium]